MNNMHHSYDVLLLNKDCRAIVAIYEPEPEEGKKNQNNRTMYKTMDAAIAVGDYINIPSNTRHKITTAKVVEVDVEPDYDSNKEIQWVIQKIDMQPYAKLVEAEQTGIRQIKKKEQDKKRDELRASLGLTEDDIKLLTVANMGVKEGEVKA